MIFSSNGPLQLSRSKYLCLYESNNPFTLQMLSSMKLKILLPVLLLFICQIASSQENTKLVTKDNTLLVTKDTTIVTTKPPVKAERRWGDGGVGIGIDYGGLIGAKATFYPIPYMGIFAAGGWELIALGWNVGVLGRIIPADGKHAARPYLKVMYGVNGATKVDGKSSYDQLFYGVTVGVGLETRFGKHRKSGINLDLNVPFRSPEFYDQINQMKNDPQIKMTNSPLPISFSIGYNVEF